MTTEKKASADRLLARRLQYFDSKYLARPGVRLLAGIDEVGRGALAGPVVAGVVVVDASCRFPGVNDSKQLDPARRELVYNKIRAKALDFAIGWATAEEIDQINIYQATLLASRRAINALQLKPDLILTDALKMGDLDVPVEPLIKGDARSQVIAAASIVAKVTRDAWMRMLDREYPGYGFAGHKGYAVPFHREALWKQGASTIHRHSFDGVDWFSQDYRLSRTIEELLHDGREQIAEVDVEELWLGRGYLLPECELRLLRETCSGTNLAEIKQKDKPGNEFFPPDVVSDPRGGTQAVDGASS